MRVKGMIVLMLVSFSIWAQQDWQNDYPFLKMEKNKVVYPGDSLPFFNFYKKLDTLFFEGKGQVNIVHIGGSHVQAGTLSNQMRENMLSLSPGIRNQRGFFFPYSLAQTNNPRNYRVYSNGNWEGFRCSVNSYEEDWGASGINATTYDKNVFVEIYALSGEELYPFKRVRIFYQFGEKSFEPRFDSTYKILEVKYDSLAQYAEFTFDKICDTLRFNIVQTDSFQTHFTLQGIQYLNDGASLNYNSIGVNGASTKSYLRCTNFQNQLVPIHADLVIFGIGINDAYKSTSQFSKVEFKNNYDALMQMFKAANPDVSFLFLSNNDSYYKRKYPNKNALAVTEVMLELCKNHGAAFWDLFEIMGGLNSVKTWEKYNLAKADKIHFTREGYMLQGDLMFNALMHAYGQYLKGANH